MSTGGRIELLTLPLVIAGLDPATHAACDLAQPHPLQHVSMDHRDKPGGDEDEIALYIRLARPVRAFGVELFSELALGKSIGIGTVTERSSDGLDERRRKLLFRAWRRGVRETDLIVGRFADAYIDKFDDAGLDDFERLIEAPNAELYAWVVGTETVPASYDTAVLAKLKEFHLQKIHLQKSQIRAEEGR